MSHNYSVLDLTRVPASGSTANHGRTGSNASNGSNPSSGGSVSDMDSDPRPDAKGVEVADEYRLVEGMAFTFSIFAYPYRQRDTDAVNIRYVYQQKPGGCYVPPTIGEPMPVNYFRADLPHSGQSWLPIFRHPSGSGGDKDSDRVRDWRKQVILDAWRRQWPHRHYNRS